MFLISGPCAIENRDVVMQTAERGLREFMNGEPLTVQIYEMEQPDVPLWAVWAIQQYAKYAGREKAFEMYGRLLQDIVTFIEDGKHPNLRLDENGHAFHSEEAIWWAAMTGEALTAADVRR